MTADRSLLVSLDSVSYAYEEELVVSDVTLEVAPGELMSIVGPSGSGKTTLLKLLAGTLEPLSGHANRSSTLKIGYVPQVETVNWYFPITVDEVVLLASPALMAKLKSKQKLHPVTVKTFFYLISLAAFRSSGFNRTAFSKARMASFGWFRFTNAAPKL